MNIAQHSTQQELSRAATGRTPTIAPDAIERLQQTVAAAQPTVLRELLELYLQDSARSIAILLTTTEEKFSGAPAVGADPLAMRAYAAGSLRQVSELVGALRLSKLCRTLEQPLLKWESPDDLQRHMQAIVREYRRVRIAIAMQRRSYPACRDVLAPERPSPQPAPRWTRPYERFFVTNSAAGQFASRTRIRNRGTRTIRVKS